MKRGIPLALVATLLLVGCAATPASHKPIAVVSGPLPPDASLIGQVRGYDLSELEDQARARDGDAITSPTTVTLRGLLQSDVVRYRR